MHGQIPVLSSDRHIHEVRECDSLFRGFVGNDGNWGQLKKLNTILFVQNFRSKGI